MSKKLTPWFPGSVKPVHVGNYLTKCTLFGCDHKHYWNGKGWLSSPSERVPVEPLPWRGLAEQPK